MLAGIHIEIGRYKTEKRGGRDRGIEAGSSEEGKTKR